MTKTMSKLVQGGGALVLAIVLALSLLPVTRAYAADGYSITINTDNLTGASASTSESSFSYDDEWIDLTITPDAGKAFTSAPVVTLRNVEYAFEGELSPDQMGNYTATITRPSGPVTITVVGVAESSTVSATLDFSGLKGATAQLSKETDIAPDEQVYLAVQPEAGKKFTSEPVVSADKATVVPGGAQQGAYLYLVTDFTGDTVITVTGEAKGDPVKPEITVGGNGTHLIGGGKSLAVTCSLPLEDLIEVLVDGKTVDPANYDKKSGSTIITFKSAYLDTLALGKHLVKLAYTGDRAASIEFTVAAKGSGDKTDSKSDDTLAKTGDPLAAPLAGVTGAAALAALAGVAALRRKQRQ